MGAVGLRLPVGVVVVTALVLVILANNVLARQPGNDAFRRTWARTDHPVAGGQAHRTWMWGPEAFTGVMEEEYAEAPGGVRTVQYFDKSRMEINDPEGDANVTNGLLVDEMILGRIQVGDAVWKTASPAKINVAGDPDDPTGPTYATFRNLAYQPQEPRSDGGTLLTQRIDRAGNVTDDPDLARHNVTAARFDTATKQNIASVFWDFMNATDVVFEDDEYVEDRLFENPYFATGRPITEAYWVNVKVGGTYKDVLLQCFERRCLTYTPDNPPGWQVEAGNVGRHYYQWRSSQDVEDPTPTTTPTVTPTSSIVPTATPTSPAQPTAPSTATRTTPLRPNATPTPATPPTATATWTPTPTMQPTATATPSGPPTATSTPTPTWVPPTFTPSPTPTPTWVPTVMPTPTYTPSP